MDIKAFRKQFEGAKPFAKKFHRPEIPADPGVQPGNRGITSGLEEYSGPWTATEAAHLLRRTTFGVKPDLLSTAVSLGMSASVAKLLEIPATPPPPVNNYNSDDPDYPVFDSQVPLGQTWVDADYSEEDGVPYGRYISVKGWWIRNILTSDFSAFEKIVLFWHNHFATVLGDIFEGRYIYKHINMLRANALGNFRTFTKEVTLDPSMLIFLNGIYNTKGAPDENYGRELQELFCVGKGPGSQYTESDVQQAARVLTGWTIINWDKQFQTEFNFFEHDPGDKTFSPFYNNKVIKGKAGSLGANELDQLLDMILSTDEVSKYICRRIYRWFVYHSIDAATETNVILPLAQILKSNNYELKPVFEKLFKSAHFFDVLNQSAIIKGGVDYLCGGIRDFNMQLPQTTQYYEDWKFAEAMNYLLYQLGQTPGDPPNVAGWSAYYQIPNFDKNWITSSTYPRRIEYIDLLLNGYYELSPNYKLTFNPLLYTLLSIPDAGNPNVLVEVVCQRMSSMVISPEVKAHMKSILLSGQLSDYYWTDAWNSWIGDPTNQEFLLTVYYRIIGMYTYLLHLEEYHLM